MVKRLVPFILLWAICLSVSFATTYYLYDGDYGYGIEVFNKDILIVQGGGADVIEMWNSSYLEVRSTSFPTNGNWHNGGITDIYLDDSSQLLYLYGWTEEITIEENAAAVIKGGSIDGITSMQKVGWHGSVYWGDPHIDLYCQPGWEWVYTDQLITGITGLWMDGTAFDITLINDEDYDPVWKNINVIVPEPATLVLLGLGGLLIRQRKR